MIRPIRAGELLLIQEWINHDLEHSAKGMTASFFAHPDRISFCIANGGGPVMFVRLDPEPPAVRVHIQFPPDSKSRVARALLDEFENVRKELKRLGATRMIFDSLSPSLIKFCQKLWGFERVGETNDYALQI